MMRLGGGSSTDEDPRRAVRHAVGEALKVCVDPDFGILFSTDQYDPEALAEAVNEMLGAVPWAGCCTAGVIAGGQLLSQGVCVGLLSAPAVRFAAGAGGPVSVDARAAGSMAVSEALHALGSASGHRTVILLPDALTGNAAEVVRGAVAAAGAGVAWAGGGAGDNLRFVRTAQFVHGRATHDHVVAIAMESALPVGIGIQHGWRPYGPPVMVTRARGCTALELDYENAFEVYRRTAAGRGDDLTVESFGAFAMTHPLGLPQATGGFLIRDPLGVEDDGGLKCVAEIPDGCVVRVMHGDCDALLAAAQTAASEARMGVEGSIAGTIVFDCVSRSLMLGPRVGEELDAIRRGLGNGVPVIGCLTFGEVGALGGPVPQFHNKTTVVVALPAGPGGP